MSLSEAAPSVEELRKAHEEYKRTVPNNYAITIQRVAAALSRRNSDELAVAVAEWLQDLNRQYYRFRPEEAATLVERLKPILRQELNTFLKFRERSITTLAKSDEAEALRMFGLFRQNAGPSVRAKRFMSWHRTSFPYGTTPSPRGTVLQQRLAISSSSTSLNSKCSILQKK